MTTYVTFSPSPNAPFQFQPTLDGQLYTAVITWNLFGQRWYINVYQLNGTLVFSLPLIDSSTGIAVQGITWASGIATVTTAGPHGYLVGQTIFLTVSGCAPDAYNGIVEAIITGPNTFTYQIANNPGLATTFGQVTFDINIAGGYFNSTLVWRSANNQFEINP